MVGNLFVGFDEVIFVEAQIVVDKRAEVPDLGSEELCPVGIRRACQKFRIAVFQMAGTGGTQGDNGIVFASLKGIYVLPGNLEACGPLAHHFQRQAAAGLLEREVNGHAMLVEQLHCCHKLFGIDEVLGTAGEDGHAEAGS